MSNVPWSLSGLLIMMRTPAAVAGLALLAIIISAGYAGDLLAEEKGDYLRAALTIVAGAGAVLVSIYASTLGHRRMSKRVLATVLIIAISGAIAGRLWFASHFPLVNDEQFYIYDAVLYNPSDAQFWKTPLLITALAGWTQVTGVDSLLEMRLLIILSAVAALSILSYIAYRLGGVLAGWTTLVVGFFMPVVMSYTSLVLTEQFMLLPLLAATLLAIVYRERQHLTWWQLLLISILLGLATAVRWSAILWLLTVAILLRGNSVREFSRRMIWLIIPFVAGFAVFLILFPDILSKYRVGGIFLEFIELSGEQGWGTKLLSWRGPALGLSPLMLLSLLTWSGASVKRKVLYAVVAVAFMMLFFPAWREASIMPSYPITSLLFFWLAVSLIVMGLLVPGKYTARTLVDATAFLVPPLITYLIVNKVNPKYFAEFIPALVLFAGLGLGNVLAALRRERSHAAAMTLLMFAWWLPPWTTHPLKQPYAGTISLAAMENAAEYLRDHVAQQERVFTASSLIPLMADRQLAYPISHPAWLRPTFRGLKDPRYDAMYNPIVVDIEAGQFEWVLDEKLTTDTYRNHPRIDAAINALYEPVTEIENKGTRPITILHLKQ